MESNPFPFNFVENYNVSTEVASMEFRTENGTQIPISDLDDSQAITVAVNNGNNDVGAEGSTNGGLPTAFNISHCDSVIVRVSMGNNNRQAGLFVQLNFTSLEGEPLRPSPTCTLHTHTGGKHTAGKTEQCDDSSCWLSLHNSIFFDTERARHFEAVI